MILDHRGDPMTARSEAAFVAGQRKAFARGLRAGYDAAQTTVENRRHWSQTDALSANAALSPLVRKILRERARYEIANNSYASGIVSTLVNYSVGTGPRLQLRIKGDDAKRAERSFAEWAAEVNLPAKLRTLRHARCQDGEAFGVFLYNPNLTHAVKLDVSEIESDQVTDPSLTVDARNADGVWFDAFGQPSRYRILRTHPGDSLSNPSAFDDVDAAQVLHTFRRTRPGQRRGVTEIGPALPLFAILRRYTLAVISAAEAAANLSGVIYADGPANDETAEEGAPFEVIELERNMFTTLPYGYKMGQMKAEQPTSTYGDVVERILNEIARCLNMPLNIAMCNSREYNFASGRLDHQTFYVSMNVDRRDFELTICDRILFAWLREAVLTGEVSQSLANQISRQTRVWMWPGYPSTNPQEDAAALEIMLRCKAENLANWYAEDGRDWETECDQRMIEEERYGVPIAASPAASPSARTQDKEKPQ